ncbi:MAG: 6-hydroxymethylpterin diphosphokinase MptE-like protein [Lachnospiraceae bacterium]
MTQKNRDVNIDSHLETNLKVLQQKDPILYHNLLHALEQPSETQELIPGVELIEERKVLYVDKGTQQYQLDSLYDSDYLLDTWFRGLKMTNYKNKIVLFGFGNGMYVRTLLENCEKEVRILLYEPSLTLFLKVLEEFDCSAILADERVVPVVAEEGELSYEDMLARELDIRDIKELILESYLNYPVLFHEEWDAFYKKLEVICQTITASQDVMGRFGASYYLNTIMNYRSFAYSKSIQELWQRLPHTLPAIIVAAGPSLDHNIEELKKAAGKSFLIAADSALRVLLAHHIVPDAFVSIDGEKDLAHFTEERIREIPLFCNLSSRYQLLEAHPDNLFFVQDMNPHVQEFLSKEEVLLPITSSGGSVANEAFSIAKLLGFTTIILVGQDLAYTDHRTHAKETVRGEQNLAIESQNTIEVEGIDGQPIASSLEFKIYLDWFEYEIKNYRGLHVIDATEGGAMIHGTEMMTLRDAIARECRQTVDIAAIIRDTPDLLNAEQKQRFETYLYDMPERLEHILSLAKRGSRAYDQMLTLTLQNRYASGDMKRIMKQVNALTAEIEEDTIYHYVQHLMQNSTTELLQDIYQVEGEEKKELITACTMGKTYMTQIQSTIDTILTDLKDDKLDRVFHKGVFHEK